MHCQLLSEGFWRDVAGDGQARPGRYVNLLGEQPSGGCLGNEGRTVGSAPGLPRLGHQGFSLAERRLLLRLGLNDPCAGLLL